MATVALAMAFAALPCFAEISVKRESATKGSITVNQAIYWNDKYGQPNFRSAKELAKEFAEDYLSSPNAAKAQFDSLCKQCYNKIAK